MSKAKEIVRLLNDSLVDSVDVCLEDIRGYRWVNLKKGDKLFDVFVVGDQIADFQAVNKAEFDDEEL